MASQLAMTGGYLGMDCVKRRTVRITLQPSWSASRLNSLILIIEQTSKKWTMQLLENGNEQVQHEDVGDECVDCHDNGHQPVDWRAHVVLVETLRCVVAVGSTREGIVGFIGCRGIAAVTCRTRYDKMCYGLSVRLSMGPFSFKSSNYQVVTSNSLPWSQFLAKLTLKQPHPLGILMFIVCLTKIRIFELHKAQ